MITTPARIALDLSSPQAKPDPLPELGRQKRGAAASAAPFLSLVQGTGTNSVLMIEAGTLALTMLKLYFRSRNPLAAVPSMVSTSPIRVTGPV